MLNQIKYFMSGVIVTLSTIFIFNLEANNDIENKISRTKLTVDNINYDFNEVDWNNMFVNESEFKNAKINSLKLKISKCSNFKEFVNNYINNDDTINIYELHLFDNYYEENC